MARSCHVQKLLSVFFSQFDPENQRLNMFEPHLPRPIRVEVLIDWRVSPHYHSHLSTIFLDIPNPRNFTEFYGKGCSRLIYINMTIRNAKNRIITYSSSRSFCQKLPYPMTDPCMLYMVCHGSHQQYPP